MYNTVSQIFTSEIYFIDYETGEELNFGNCLNGIAIKKDYATNIFPLYVLSLKLSVEHRNYLATHNFYVSLKMYRCTMNTDTQSSEETTSTDQVTDKQILSILLKPFDPSKNATYINKTEINNNNQSEEEEMVSYTLNCIPKEELTINNGIVNACFSNANINEIVLNLISEVYQKDIYYQESSNIERYESLLIPPMSIVPALRYLHSGYSIYKNRLNMFFDSAKLYVYDILDIDRPMHNNCFIEIVTDADDQQNKYRTIYLDENDNIKKYYTSNPVFISNRDTYRYATGEQIIYNSYDDNFNLVTRSYKTNDTGSNMKDQKTRYMWNTMKSQLKEMRLVNGHYVYTTISLQNIDPSLFNPDTLFSISGTIIPEFSGQYILLGSETYYSSHDFRNYQASINLNLVKI